MIETELNQLEERVQRLSTGYRQARLELKRALQERDRLLALNSELRRRIEAIVERVRTLETAPEVEMPDAAMAADDATPEVEDLLR